MKAPRWAGIDARWVVGLVVLAGAVWMAVPSSMLTMALVALTLAVGTAVLLHLPLQGQVIAFVALGPVFMMAQKVGFGRSNTRVTALLPSIWLALILIQAGLRWLRRGGHVRLSVLDWLVIAFVVLDAVQLFNPYLDFFVDRSHAEVGLRGWQQRSYMALIYFVARATITSPKAFGKMTFLVVCVAGLSALYAILQLLLGTIIGEQAHREVVAAGKQATAMYDLRGVGFLNSPFAFGLDCAVSSIGALYVATRVGESRLARSVASACLAFGVGGTALSASRTTYTAVLAVCVLVILRTRPVVVLRTLWKAKWVIAGVSLVVTVMIARLGNERGNVIGYSLERMASVIQLVDAKGGFTEKNFEERRVLAVETWPLILANPIGYGTGIFSGGSNENQVVNVRGYSTWVDNEFSSLMLELGIPGVVLLVAIVAIALWASWGPRHVGGRSAEIRTAGAIVALLFVAGIGGQWLTAYPVNIVFWTMLGVIAAWNPAVAGGRSLTCPNLRALSQVQ